MSVSIPIVTRSDSDDKANPWEGRIGCPQCGTSTWTMPFSPNEPWWRCVDCHHTFTPPQNGVT